MWHGVAASENENKATFLSIGKNDFLNQWIVV
jgi:hypothetical protein